MKTSRPRRIESRNFCSPIISFIQGYRNNRLEVEDMSDRGWKWIARVEDVVQNSTFIVYGSVLQAKTGLSRP
jgi:hypothetical protein